MSQEPNPVRIFNALTAYQRSAALKGAIDLDLFTAIGEGNDSIAALAKHCGAAERGVRILCDYLVVEGFLSKSGERYALGPDAATFLDRRLPTYFGGIAGFLNSSHIKQAFEDVAGAVRKGGTLIEEGGAVAPDHAMWVTFARSMMSFAALTSELIAALLEADAAPRWRVLDVAAGHGLFGVMLAKHNPNAEIVAQDWANVLAVAQENALAVGVGDRFRTLPGNAFEVDFGSGYDLVLLTNILHHFDAASCERLLRKVRAALAPGGRAVTLEFVPNDDRVSPPEAAEFSLVMLASTPAGDAYTFKELERMFANTGFARSELHDLPPSPQRVVISYV